MDFHSALLALLGLTCGVLGWFGREMYAAVKLLQQDLNKLEVKITSEYVRYDRLKDALEPIKEEIEEIKHALAGKADRP